MNRHRMLLLLIVCLTALALLMSCTDDKECPTCPTEPVSDYNVYMADRNSNKIYIYNTLQMDIIDTLTLPSAEIPIDIDVSYDGSQLLVTTESGLTVYELPSLDVVASKPYGEDIEVSWSGKYVALMCGDSLVVLDGYSYEHVLSDTLHCMNPRFSLDDSKIYCVKDSQYVRAYDIAADSIVMDLNYISKIWGDGDVILSVSPTYDDNKCILSYYYLDGSSTGWRVSCFYYIGQDSSVYMPSGYNVEFPTDIKSFSSGKLLYSSIKDSTRYASNWQVVFLSASKDMTEAAVPCGYALNDSTGLHGFVPNGVTVTPDEHYTVVASGYSPSGFGLIDNRSYCFISVRVFDDAATSFGAVACQKKEK